MKIECICGHLISDGGDSLSHKAHILPDAALFQLMDAFDNILLHRCQTATQREAACTTLRELVTRATRQGWQCSQCGRLYIDDSGRALNIYAPDGEATKSLFVP